ncbi:unnamed protein product [Victoria cruziana]
MRGFKLGSAEAAGEVLDWHGFYKEVTARGGYEKVITENKWDEVAHTLNFTCNIYPVPSFTLQKNYVDLLYPFEQVFYSHRLHPPPGILPALVTVKNSSTQHDNQDFLSRKGKRRNNPNLLSEGEKNKGSLVGKTLSGSIRTEFHGGYLVTVEVGSLMLNGLLCHEPGSGDKQSAAAAGWVAELDCDADLAKRRESVGTEASRAKAASAKRVKKQLTKDGRRNQDAPLRVRTAYHFFYGAQSERLKKQMKEGSKGGIRKMVGDTWKFLSEIDKMPYIEMNLQDKARYRREMQAYEEQQQKKLLACKMHGVGVNPVDEQSEQDLKEDDDCYRVSLDMQAEAGDATGVSANIQAFVDDIFCPGCLMNDSDLLAHVASQWCANGDMSSYLPSFSNAT